MNQVNRFCTACGQPVNPAARFCQSCGQGVAAAAAPAYTPPPPAYEPPPQYAPPAQPDYQPQAQGYAERLVGVLPGLSRRKGLMSVEAFNAVVTDGRIIFAQQTNKMVQEEAKKKRGGFLSNMAGAMSAGFNIWKRYLEMAPEQALQETPGNFFIAMNQIRKVKYDGGRTLYKKGAFTVGINTKDDDDGPAKLEIETVAEKFKFDVPSFFQNEVGDTLRQAGLIKK